MSETDPAIIGMQSCGCITYANSRPDDLHRDDERDLARIIREGGQIIRTTVGEARAMPHFLASECPHDPKGWEREPYVDPSEAITLKTTYRKSTYMVRRGYGRIGEVRKWEGAWQATPGWFNPRDGEANDGYDPREPAPVICQFGKRQEAIDALVIHRLDAVAA